MNLHPRPPKFRSTDRIPYILKSGTSRANAIAEETLAMAKEAAGLGYFDRRLELG